MNHDEATEELLRQIQETGKEIDRLEAEHDVSMRIALFLGALTAANLVIGIWLLINWKLA